MNGQFGLGLGGSQVHRAQLARQVREDCPARQRIAGRGSAVRCRCAGPCRVGWCTLPSLSAHSVSGRRARVRRRQRPVVRADHHQRLQPVDWQTRRVGGQDAVGACRPPAVSSPRPRLLARSCSVPQPSHRHRAPRCWGSCSGAVVAADRGGQVRLAEAEVIHGERVEVLVGRLGVQHHALPSPGWRRARRARACRALSSALNHLTGTPAERGGQARLAFTRL